MARTINVTSTATPGGSETITSTTYRLLDSDGSTELSTANPPYVGVSDGVLYVEQTVTQSDTQTHSVIRTIPGRVTDAAATDDAAPVITWTDVAGETSYDLYRGASGFQPDTETFADRIATGIAAGVTTYTDSAVTGDGATVYAYRLVAKTAYGFTIGNEATCTPAEPASGANDYGFDDFERVGALELSAMGTPTWGGVDQTGLSWTKRDTPSAYIVSGRVAGDASGNAKYSLEGMTIPGADYEVAVRQHRISTLNYPVSILLAYDTATDSYYRASLDISSLKFRIYRQHAGAASSALLVTASTALTWDVSTSKETLFRRTINGSGNPVLTVYVDGVEHVTYTDTNANKITWVGIAGFINAGNSANGFHLSDFRARPVSA